MSTEVEVVSSSSKIIWKIENISDLNSVIKLDSEVFSVGDFKWKVQIFPKGYGKVYNCLSLFLVPVDLTKSVNAQFSFAISSQSGNISQRVRKEVTYEFPERNSTSYGWPRFILLSELHDPDNGHIINDTFVIRIEVSCRMKEDSICDNFKESDSDKVPVSEAKKKQSSTLLEECPSAGKPFGEGQYSCKVGFGDDKEFEDVGGFSILKTQVPLYRQIWLKYGHIATNKVMPISAYALLVMAVRDLMNSIIDMHQCRYVELSSGMIEGWEEMVMMAEKFEFNIGWLRERLETVKKPLRVAQSRVKAAGDELKKAEAQLIAAKNYLRENVSGVLSQSDMEMCLDIGENLLLDGLF
ncbi:MATH domain and coiled-coil domain-containing protein At3g58210-like [Papaver somniferum]|uniref:MATH domain and coiled-coil domain-containing protein At3g58210-like n=1 Tax=Papaver somniferum TaxID=3469 RepID=UPI000E6F7064|nr:MATH domain and coiled-coil domain-containing protein At3g58210-like [Papaver somniferum]